ncbi:hypothetical protein Micbo1qcDRAFT_161402 [Microdochium bolleyi]|uniref:Uncharacterized protein n=1 Tax=Microdochium bolleyi TaxID=196109 RepID=A0A136J886_9PEZI|nr:hypothetical protein Micbo1qcDRAFT_161402 [Microdochium bolleyi]
MPRVWLNVRRVSRFLKAATELAFCDRHLRNTEIIFRDYGCQLLQSQARVAAQEEGLGNALEGAGRPLHLKFVLEFHGLSHDRMRAIFRRKAVDSETGKLWLQAQGCSLADLMDARWREISQAQCRAGSEQGRDPLLTPPFSHAPTSTAYVITTRRVANDTALPGFQMHHEQGSQDDDTSTSDQVSVLWQPMLSQLFGEEEYIKWAKKVDYQHSAMRKNLDSISALVRTGELPLDEFFKLMSDYTSKNSRKVLDTVRRERLRRQAARVAGAAGTLTPLGCSAGHLDIVERARESVFWAEFTDEWRFAGSEENEGNFYDGTGRLFQGNTELNKPEDDAAVQAKMEECEVPGASWYAGSDCSEDDDEMEW